MNIANVYNEDAIELLADIIEPAAVILADEEVKTAYKTNKMALVKTVLRKHSREVVEVLAALDGVKVEDYKANIIVMTKSLLELVNDKELMAVFQSQGQMMDEIRSGSAMENSEAVENE